MRSFRLEMSEPGTPPADGFVSFKTIPDEEKARSLAECLKDEGFKVTFIHGDSACPHPFGSKEANRWIQQLLSTQHYRVLLSIASEDSLRSHWVFQEFYEGTQKCPLIILLWYGRSNPTSHFFPDPSWLTRRLPALASTYLVDCRSDPGDAARIAASIFASIPEDGTHLWPPQALCRNRLRTLEFNRGRPCALPGSAAGRPDPRNPAGRDDQSRSQYSVPRNLPSRDPCVSHPLPAQGPMQRGECSKDQLLLQPESLRPRHPLPTRVLCPRPHGPRRRPDPCAIGAAWIVTGYLMVRGLRRMFILRSYRAQLPRPPVRGIERGAAAGDAVKTAAVDSGR